MATDAQRRKLKEALRNGGRLKPWGVHDDSLALMFEAGLIEVRITADADGLAQVREREVLNARSTLTGPEPVNWPAALGQLKRAEEAQEELDLLVRLQERQRQPRPMERYELQRFGSVAGVFVTERGRAEAALAKETVQERIERRAREDSGRAQPGDTR